MKGEPRAGFTMKQQQRDKEVVYMRCCEKRRECVQI